MLVFLRAIKIVPVFASYFVLLLRCSAVFFIAVSKAERLKGYYTFLFKYSTTLLNNPVFYGEDFPECEWEKGIVADNVIG